MLRAFYYVFYFSVAIVSIGASIWMWIPPTNEKSEAASLFLLALGLVFAWMFLGVRKMTQAELQRRAAWSILRLVLRA